VTDPWRVALNSIQTSYYALVRSFLVLDACFKPNPTEVMSPPLLQLPSYST
jgi:hypothetical protein